MTSPRGLDDNPADDARASRLAACWASLLDAGGELAGPAAAAVCDTVDTTPHLAAEQRARLWRTIAATPDPTRTSPADRPRLAARPHSPNGRHPAVARPPAPPWPRWSAAQTLASLLLVAALAGGGLAVLRATMPRPPDRTTVLAPARAATPGPGVAIEPIVSTTTGAMPYSGTAAAGVSRLTLGPRATIAPAGSDVSLALVESGALTLTADQPVLVARAAAAGQPRALQPERDPRLGPGDWYTEPDGVDAVAANPSGSESTVLLVFSVSDLYASSMPTTGQVDGTVLNSFTQPSLPANPARMTIARATFAPGATLPAPAPGTFQFAAPAEADTPILKVSTDGSAKNVGDRPVTAYLLTVEPLPGGAATPAAIRAAGSATIVPEVSTTTDRLPASLYCTLWIFRQTLGPRTTMTQDVVRDGPALVLVERGSPAVTASEPLPVARAASAVAGRPLVPTPERNPVLGAGDWVAVPAGVDARWSNPSADAAVLLAGSTDEPRSWPTSGVLAGTVAAGPTGQPPAPPVAQAAPDASAAVAASQPQLHRLDPPARPTTVLPGSIATLQLGSLTQPPLPATPATVAMSLVRLPAGSTLPPPPPGEVRLFAAEPRDGAWLRAGVDGSARNVGDHEITVHLLSVAPAR